MYSTLTLYNRLDALLFTVHLMLYYILDLDALLYTWPWCLTIHLFICSNTDDFPTTRTALSVLGSGLTLESLPLLYSRDRSWKVFERYAEWYFFFLNTTKPRVEWYKSIWALIMSHARVYEPTLERERDLDAARRLWPVLSHRKWWQSRFAQVDSCTNTSTYLWLLRIKRISWRTCARTDFCKTTGWKNSVRWGCRVLPDNAVILREPNRY